MFFSENYCADYAVELVEAKYFRAAMNSGMMFSEIRVSVN